MRSHPYTNTYKDYIIVQWTDCDMAQSNTININGKLTKWYEVLWFMILFIVKEMCINLAQYYRRLLSLTI